MAAVDNTLIFLLFNVSGGDCVTKEKQKLKVKADQQG